MAIGLREWREIVRTLARPSLVAACQEHTEGRCRAVAACHAEEKHLLFGIVGPEDFVKPWVRKAT